jgi:Arc/MetJ family transcription regulator
VWREAALPTNLAIDDRLIDQARRIGRHKTKKEAVTAALKEYVQRRRQQRVLDLVGQIEYEPDYEYKELRRRGRKP